MRDAVRSFKRFQLMAGGEVSKLRRGGLVDRRGQMRRVWWLPVFATAFVLVAAVGMGNAVADESPSLDASSGPTLQQLEDAHWRPLSSAEPTEASAAAQLPHDELGRTEASELLTSVFQPVLEEANGVYDEVEVERYDSNYEAVVRPDGGLEGPALLESTLPLRVENEGGQLAPVDLGLEPAEGKLQPANPLVEVGIPASLEEGIALPEAGLTVKLAGQEGQIDASTLVGGSAAFYPNVAQDTDLTVMPNPLGVETMTQVRTPEAPRTQTFELELAPGQTLREAGDGGAEVVSEGKTVMAVHAPSAIDAAGEDVPATMTTAGDSLTIVIEPDQETAYPILVDPIWDVYVWGQYGGPRPDYSGWTTYQNTGAIYPAETQGGYWGLTLNSWSGPTPVLSQARWDWHVPRWAQDKAAGKTPSSYIVNAWGGYIDFDTEAAANGGNITTDPFLDLYLWDEATGFVGGYYYRHYGTEGDIDAPSASYPLPGYGDTNAKQMSFELVTTSSATQYRHIFLGYAKMEIADNDNPILSGTFNPSGWVNNSPTIPLPFSIEDTGLGAWALNLGQPTTSGSGWTGFTTRYGACTGGSAAPCPRNWSSAGGPAVTYDPSQMPQGEDTIQLQAVDPLGHASAVANEIVKVDHTKPTLTATGAYGEEGTPAEPVYTVKYKATDGTAASPQSGAASLQVKVDGKVERSLTPGCATKNCEISGELTLAASKFGSGTHTVEVSAADGVGLAATPVTLSFSLERPDTVIDSGPEGLTNQSTPGFTYHAVPSGSTFRCAVDGGAFISCPATGYTTAALSEGHHTFEVKAVNGAGLADAAPAKREFTIDTVAPDTTIEYGPSGATNDPTPVFGYSSEDEEATFECKVDSGAYVACGPTYETAKVADGAHTFTVRAVDPAGNVDPTPATRSFTVDTSVPTATIESGPEGLTRNSNPVFTFSTTNASSVTCALDAAATEGESPSYGPCTTSTSYTAAGPLADGTYRFRVHAENAAGSEAVAIRMFTVDNVAPETTIISGPTGTTDEQKPTFTFASSDAGSTFECRFDAEAFGPCSGPGATATPASALADGSHTFYVRASDRAGNTDATPASRTFTLATNGPQTTITAGPEGAITVTSATFKYVADEPATFQCRLDGAAFASCPAETDTLSGLSNGEHVFEVRAVNGLSVVDPTPARRAFVVDTTPPAEPVLSGPMIEPGVPGLTLHVEVTDGSTAPGGTVGSGVEGFTVYMDGQPVESYEARCSTTPKSCPQKMTRTIQVPTTAIGSHGLEVKSHDAVNLQSKKNWSETTPLQDSAVPREATATGSAVDNGCNGGGVADTILPKPGQKVERGTARSDLIISGPNVRTIRGFAGCDIIVGGPGEEKIEGGKDDDTIRGGRSDDMIKGGPGNDRIYGGTGDDHLYGGAEEDVIDGGPGSDHIKGQGGNDTIRGSQGQDKVEGGGGTDTLSYADAVSPGFVDNGEPLQWAKNKNVGNFPVMGESGVYINLTITHPMAYDGQTGDGGGVDTLEGPEKGSFEVIVGSPFDDWIEGNSPAEEIDTGRGADLVDGVGTIDVKRGPKEKIEENLVYAGGTDSINGSPGSITPRGESNSIQIGEQESDHAKQENDVFLLGGTADDLIGIKESNTEVTFVPRNSGTKGHLTPLLNEAGTGSECHTQKKGGNVTCPIKRLGSLLVYGGQGNDRLLMSSEKPKKPGWITLDGGPGSDVLHGLSMDELLIDGAPEAAGADELDGGGGDDALIQGKGSDTVIGGNGSDLVVSSAICGGDKLYGDEQGEKAADTGADNAQFRPLQSSGVYANLEEGRIGTVIKGEVNKCGTFSNFNDVEGSEQADDIYGTNGPNLLIGASGKDRLFGLGKKDKLAAKDNTEDNKIDCGGQKGDKAVVDHIDVEKGVVTPEDCQHIHVAKGRGQGGGLGRALLFDLTGTEPPSAGGILEERNERHLPKSLFALDDSAGTAAYNEIEGTEEGVYEAAGVGPSVNGPGPTLGVAGALAGEEGTAVKLDGVDDYINLKGQALPEAEEEGYSLAMDVKFGQAPGQTEYLFSGGSSNSGIFLYRNTGGRIVFATGLEQGAPLVRSAEPITDEGWHQVVATLEGETVAVNVDGFPVNLGYGENVLPTPDASAPSLVGTSLGHALFLKGTVDEVASYGAALNESDAFEQLAESEIEEPPLLLAPPVETVDTDGDGIIDGADNCPTVANSDQADTDENGIGDACEAPDTDGDGIPDATDNCPDEYNPEQTDSNGDGLGDACVEMPPEADIAAATAITTSSATLNGTVNPEGTLTNYQFEYGTTNAYGTKVPVTAPSAGSGIAMVPVNTGIAGLAPGTTYHYQLVASNEFGEVDSEDGVFTTPKAPAATTLPASAITTTGATLNGSVNAEGNATTYQFEYGKTAAYGSKAPASAESAGSGTSGVTVSQALTGLEPNTYYHYRVIATNAAGTAQSADALFKTSPTALVGSELIAMPVNETFNGKTESINLFNSNWSALGWATGSPTKGEDSAGGWRPVNAFPTEQGAYWHPVLTDTGSGVAALATVTGNPTITERYFAVWIDMSTPGTTRNGYELRFTETTENASIYTVELSKWVSGTLTVLGSKAGYSLPVGSTFGIADLGNTVSAWAGSGGSLTQIISATDSTYSSGTAAIEGAGNILRLNSFRAGTPVNGPTTMSSALVTLPVNAPLTTTETTLSEGGNWAALGWDTAGTPTGHVAGGWGPSAAFPAINGAYWKHTAFADSGSGLAVAATLANNPTITERYFSLWLDLAEPGTTRNGYELRFTETTENGSVYTATLSRWQAGVKTVLGTLPGYALPLKSKFALAKKAGVVSAWVNSGSGYTQILSAADTTFTGGYTGLEGSGNITRLTEFSGGPLPPF